MTKQITITILELQKRLNTEEVCHQYLYEHKWPNSFEYLKCKNNEAYEIKTHKLLLYECTQCDRQTTGKVGTISLMTHDKRGSL